MSADQNNKPAGLTSRESALWIAPPPDDKKPVDPHQPKCMVCGRALIAAHSENKCLRAEVLRLREKVTSLETMLRLERAGRGPGPQQEIEPKKG